ncbi:hypothetical protein A0J48_004365 [Sphaerospermopsis aphanizomenoides BCCUSP55]|uniref:hypothetical protein n=1 Tax=Sphaerospermopsis aphanizomenoides TaxID=459663 RepID=UPI001907B989|nr:hypothetical protein [Sphaerospermopsis aphanizomenoides]MBK1986783.1 hypothetical protein [Sphaerospermopsis aphanizomenoides BCCUSP55]
MSTLDEDLEKYANEAWNHHDIKAGFKLLAELGGIVGLGIFGYTILTSWIPGLNALGIPISTAMACRLLATAGQQYCNLSEEERAVVRKAVRFISSLS